MAFSTRFKKRNALGQNGRHREFAGHLADQHFGVDRFGEPAVDAGRAINPALVADQIEGGVVQAHGYAVTEELVVRDASEPFLVPLVAPRSVALIRHSGPSLQPRTTSRVSVISCTA